MAADNNHYVRKVVLPSGKTIEVVYFEDQLVQNAGVGMKAPQQAAPAATAKPASDLHVCGHCDSKLVYPTDWCEAGAHHWEVSLRCPNCEWNATGVYEQEIVEAFDEELDRGTESVVRDLRRLAQANMEDEIERFSAALHAGYIQPEDF